MHLHIWNGHIFVYSIKIQYKQHKGVRLGSEMIQNVGNIE